MSQSPGAGSASAAATTVSSSHCQELSVRGKGPREEDVSLWRAPSQGAAARVPRGAGAAGKVEAEHQLVPTVLPGWGGWLVEVMWVCVS